nr:reverse transcriptase domain-containing protein [Tanacetum cinerariifolium]
PSDMIGVPRSVAKHRLNIREGYLPVRQKKMGQAPKRAKAIQAEVKKLVEAGTMREVYYHDWLSNPVMVKKHDDSWRMCLDFTDLNKAYPQDCYPLPEINWKVKSLCGYPFKCLLGAYKGYHQIHLAESDEEKTAFHTGQRVYCYTKLPFGLRKVGVTYQWLVDKAFDSQIGHNIEVYVDDLVIKSHTESEMLRDIGETAGLILTSPEGTEFTYALRFQFAASNNEVEYEALIAGLRIAAQMGVKNVHVNVDSKLVANQVLGAYVAKEENLNKYLEKVEELPYFLWAHHTMINSSHGDTPFSLTYGTEAVIPAEIGMPTYRTVAVDVVHNDEELRLNLDLLEERRKCVAIRKAKAKLKMTKYYNARVRGVTFRPCDFVYRNNDASHAVDGGKLGPK